MINPNGRTLWQVTLHKSETLPPYLGTFFDGTPEEAFKFGLSLRPDDTPVWIRIEHIPCLVIIQ